MLTKKKCLFSILVFTGFLFTHGCNWATPVPTVTPIPPTETPLPPSPTPLPLAIRVNTSGILLTDYEEELKRFDAAMTTLGKTYTAEDRRERVLDELIGSELLYQEAIKNGYVLSDEDLNARIGQLVSSAGGEAGFNTWLQNNGYTVDSFRRFLIRNLGAAWQRDQIIKALPEAVEQIHARQIFFSREEGAAIARQKVDNGADFSVLAIEADPVTKGDLGWFPRGYLLQPEVEEAAFQLQPGQVSQVVKSSIGYHLVQLIERDPAKKLDPDARAVLEKKAITDWVSTVRSNAKIDVLVP